MKDKRIQERLLREVKLTLEKQKAWNVWDVEDSTLQKDVQHGERVA